MREDGSEYGQRLQSLADRFGDVRLHLEFIAKTGRELLNLKADWHFDFEFDHGTGDLTKTTSIREVDDCLLEYVEEHREFCQQYADILGKYLKELLSNRAGLQAEIASLSPKIHRRLSDCRGGKHWSTIVQRHVILESERWPRLPTREVWNPNISIHPRRASVPVRLDHLLLYFAESDPTELWQTICRRIDSCIDDIQAVARGLGTRVDVNPDGPFGAYQWRNKGVELQDKVRPLTWKLCKFVLSRRDWSATFEDLEGPVWEMGECPDAAQVGRQRTLANDYFSTNKVPLKLASSPKDRKLWVERVAELDFQPLQT